MTRTDTDDLSEIAQLIQKRQRRTYEYDVGPYVGLGGTVAKVAIRVPTKREQDIALAGAHEYVARLAEKTPKLADDPEILLDTKAAFIVATACRRPNDPKGLPAWPSGGWLHEKLTPDEIACLFRIVIQVRDRESATPTRIEQDMVDAYARRFSAMSETDWPDLELATHTQAFLVQLYMLTLARLDAASARVSELEKQLGSQGEQQRDDEGAGVGEGTAS